MCWGDLPVSSDGMPPWTQPCAQFFEGKKPSKPQKGKAQTDYRQLKERCEQLQKENRLMKLSLDKIDGDSEKLINKELEVEGLENRLLSKDHELEELRVKLDKLMADTKAFRLQNARNVADLSY